MNAYTEDVKVSQIFLEMREILEAFTWHMVYAVKIRFL